MPLVTDECFDLTQNKWEKTSKTCPRNDEEIQKSQNGKIVYIKMKLNLLLIAFGIYVSNFVNGNIPKVNKCCQENEVS